MSENDAQLELKKRARRRLVGAAALAVLAAVVLPMVMDREPKPAAQDIQIRIPSQDAGAFGSRILPAKPGAVPTPLPAAPAEAPAAAEPPRAEPAKPAPAPLAAKTEKPGTPPPEPRAPAPAEDKPPAKTTEEARPQPAKDEATKAEAASGGEQWIVQIGAYRDAANVRNLQAKLKEQGYNFYTEPLVSDGVKKTRVRAGPFPSKEAAEKARDRLKRIGVDGLVAQKQ